MGFFDSKSTQETNQKTDSRATQAGNDVNQTNVSLGKKAKNNTVNIVNTDHGAVRGALEVAAKTSQDSLGVVKDAMDFADTQNRRVTDAMSVTAKENTKVVDSSLSFADTQNRRVLDAIGTTSKENTKVVNSALDVVDSGNRRSHDTANNAMSKMLDSIKESFSFSDTQVRRAVDSVNASNARESKAYSSALSAVSNNNRRTLDAIDRNTAKSYGFIESSLGDMLSVMDTKDRRQSDSIKEALETVTANANQSTQAANASADKHVESIKELAKSVTIGNEEGTNRLLLALIIGVVIVAIVIGAIWILGK